MRTVEERFWEKVDKRGPDECWEWTASKRTTGYGQFKVDAKMVGAHRYSFTLCCGDIPLDMCVCHRCDNKACVNPGHLFLGTNAENSEDKCLKNRQSKGESHGRAKLTEARVCEIRALLKGGMPHRQVARLYSLANSSVWLIGHGINWKHLSTDSETTEAPSAPSA